MRVTIAIALVFIVFQTPASSPGEQGMDRASANDSIADANVGLCGGDPLTAEYIGWYFDGGTMGASVTDSNGCLVEFYVDHRMSSATPGALYVGARVPSSPKASLASLAEVKYIQQLIVQVLKSTCGEEFPSILSQLIEELALEAEGAQLIEKLLDVLDGC